jgi:hypothetical protein
MLSPAADLQSFIATVAGGWSVFVGVRPDTPDNCIAIYDTGGDGPDTDELEDYLPTVQVAARSADYASAYDRMEAIRNLLIQTQPIEVTDSIFPYVMMQSEILSIGRDERNRHILTANYRCRRNLKETT